MKYKLVRKEYLDGYVGYFVHYADSSITEESLIYPRVSHHLGSWTNINIRGMSKEHCLEYIRKLIKKEEDSKKFWTVVSTTEEFV